MDALLLISGLLVLVGGAELLVRGATGLAGRLGVSPLVIGLTVVAFGTSSPEVAVSLSAAAGGKPDLALGNVVGSNTFNVLFILGVSALVRPLLVQQKLVRIDVPIMIGISGAVWLQLADGVLGRFDGLLLLAGIAAYTALAVRAARRESRRVRGECAEGSPGRRDRSLVRPIAFLAIGLVGAVLGARWFVAGAVSIAGDLGISQLVIGLTIVAAGTSMPEVATSVVAAVRGQRDIAVGNVVGSNIFNILAILGLTGLLAEGLPVSPALLAFDLPVMVAVTLVCLPIVFTGHEIRRWEGALLLAGYGVYVGYIVLDSTGHDAISGYSAIVLWFVLPFAFIGVLASVLGSLRASRRRQPAAADS